MSTLDGYNSNPKTLSGIVDTISDTATIGTLTVIGASTLNTLAVNSIINYGGYTGMANVGIPTGYYFTQGDQRVDMITAPYIIDVQAKTQILNSNSTLSSISGSLLVRNNFTAPTANINNLSATNSNFNNITGGTGSFNYLQGNIVYGPTGIFTNIYTTNISSFTGSTINCSVLNSSGSVVGPTGSFTNLYATNISSFTGSTINCSLLNSSGSVVGPTGSFTNIYTTNLYATGLTSTNVYASDITFSDVCQGPTGIYINLVANTAVSVGNSIFQANKKDTYTLNGCLSIDANDTQNYLNYTFTATPQYSYSFSSSTSVSGYESWRGFGLAGQWNSTNNYSSIDGSYVGGQSTTSSGVAYTGEWVQVNFSSCCITQIIFQLTRASNSSSTTAGYVICLYDGTNWNTVYTGSNASTTQVAGPTINLSSYNQYTAMRFIATSCNENYGTLGRVSFGNIQFYGYDTIKRQIYFPQSVEIGRSPVVANSIPTIPLTVNGNASISQLLFHRVYAFDCIGGSGSVPTNGCYCGYGAISYLLDNYNMFSTPTSGCQAPRTGFYHISFNCRVADINATLAIIPRVVTSVGAVVKNYPTIFIPADGTASYRRSIDWSNVGFMNATEYFQPICPYAVSTFGWSLSACYLGDA